MAEQSNKIQNINQAIYGLNTDSVSDQTKPGQLTYALNAQIENFDGNMVTYQNEQSTVLCREFKTGYKVIGLHNIFEQNRTVLFLVNPDTGDSEIGYIDTILTCDYNDPTGLDKVISNDYVNNGYNSIDCDCEHKIDSEEILSFYELFKRNNITSDVNNDTCCKYTTVINARCLNFNINYPIYKAVHKNKAVDLDDEIKEEIPPFALDTYEPL